MIKKLYSTLFILCIGITQVSAQTTVYTKDALKYIESIVYEMNNTVMKYGAKNKWGDLDSADVDTMEVLYESMIEALRDIDNYDRNKFSQSFISYLDYCRDIYQYDTDRTAYSKNIGTPFEQQIQSILSGVLTTSASENIRRFNVKNGEQAERLNLLEMAVSIMWFSPSTTDPMNSGPLQYEPILRFQSLGYQLNFVNNKMEVASPFIQAGISYYFYGDTWIERTINHVGLAAAVQYDFSVKHLAAGAVLHVESYDIGILFNTDPNSNQKSVVFSGNIQIIKNWF